MLKGLILFGTFSLILFLLIVTLEYFGRFSSDIRLFLLLSFIIGSLGVLIYYVLIPISKLFSFGKLISREQASKIIGDFFPDINDKLFNTLQLANQKEADDTNLALLNASISKRSSNLSAFDFRLVINLKKNYRYLKFFIPPIAILILILAINPDFIKLPTERVISFDKTFKEPKDFDFFIQNLPDNIQEGDDFVLKMEVKGRIFPQGCYIHTNLGMFKMKKEKANLFSFTFSKVAKTIPFYFSANNITSNEYQLKVIPKSVIGHLNAKIIFPKYLAREPESFTNAADMTIPEGSTIIWDVLSENTVQIDFHFSDSTFRFDKQRFNVKKRFFNSTALNILLKNAVNSKVDTVSYSIQIIKDAYPSISANEVKDTISSSIRFFNGIISDDYGLTNLIFHYNIKDKNGRVRQKDIPVVRPNGTSFQFNFAHDFRTDSLSTDDVIDYYFTVFDNDGINGPKSTKSQTFVYKLPSEDELIAKRNETIDNSKDNIKDLMNKVDKFTKNLDDLQKKSLYSKSNQWDNMNKLKNLQQDRQNLQNEIQKLQNQLNESMSEKNSLQQMDSELKEKYDLLQQLLDKVMDKEMKDLLDELSKLLQKNDKYNLENKFDQLNNKSQDINNQLDRSLELLKRTQVNELMKDVQNRLNELADEQQKLRYKEIDKSIKKDDALEKQKDINDKFEQMKDDLNKLKDLNKDLNRPYELEQFDKSKQEISNDLQDASNQLQKNQNKSAQNSQKSAADKMKQMSSSMNAMQQQAQQQQNSEDMKLIRLILKSLINASFDQENFIDQIASIQFNDPRFPKLARQQKQLNDDVQPLLDSLLVIAKRQPQTSSFIDKELSTIRNSQSEIIRAYSNRDKSRVAIHSQFLMTSFNNLALLLNESLQQMQQQMQQQGGMSGGSCDKPSSGKSGKSGKSRSQGQGQSGEGEMGDMKDILKKQLDQLKKAMQNGGQQPGNQPGNSQSPGQGGNQSPNGMPTPELAKMIAEQRLLRQKLEQLRQQLNQDGQGNGNNLNPIIKDLDKQENDLLNRKIGREQLSRQQDILTRMLESDKALKTRGLDEKRQSETAKSYNYSNQNRIDEYNKEKLHQLELFKTVDPNYNKYYKDKASEYFNRQY